MKTIYERIKERMHGGESGESGQAMIELAVSLPLMMVMLFGAAELGMLAYVAIEVSDAAKAGAQYGSRNEAAAQDTAGITLTAQKNAPYAYATCSSFSATIMSRTVSGNVQLPCTCISSGVPSPVVPTYAACSAACTGYIVPELVVTTSASCNPLIHAPGISTGNITLSGHAIQEVLN